jgi:hypothetical protein
MCSRDSVIFRGNDCCSPSAGCKVRLRAPARAEGHVLCWTWGWRMAGGPGRRAAGHVVAAGGGAAALHLPTPARPFLRSSQTAAAAALAPPPSLARPIAETPSPPPPVPPTFRPMPSVPGSDRGQVPNQRPDLHHFCHHGGRLPLRQADPARLQPSSPCEQRAALARVAAVAGAPPRRRRRAAAAPLRPSHRWGTGRPCQRRRRPAGHRARPPLIGGLTERRNDCIFTAQTLLEASKTGHAHIGGVPCRTA